MCYLFEKITQVT